MNDSLIIQAYERVLRTHRLSADELVCTPAARDLFLAFAREEISGDGIGERELLMRLLGLRKRSRLPRFSDPSVTEAGAEA
jgi:hypothetical protein